MPLGMIEHHYPMAQKASSWFPSESLSDSKDQTRPGLYLAGCQPHGQPLTVDRPWAEDLWQGVLQALRGLPSTAISVLVDPTDTVSPNSDHNG